MTRFLYETIPGRIILRLLISPAISKITGCFLDSFLSIPLIKPFFKAATINPSDYENEKYRCFNDAFTRRIRKSLRPIDLRRNALIAPCDGMLSIYSINSNRVLPIKHSHYSINDLVDFSKHPNGDNSNFKDGYCLVFRLGVENYHRYSYIDDCILKKTYRIDGKLHTVRPIALRHYPVFTENSREISILETRNFGEVLEIEVGAMFVGKIVNNHSDGIHKKGEEKGFFKYGGSTIVLLLNPNAATLNEELLSSINSTKEFPVKLGECIGLSLS